MGTCSSYITLVSYIFQNHSTFCSKDNFSLYKTRSVASGFFRTKGFSTYSVYDVRLLRNLGSSVNGDERLFYFTEKSCYIRLVPPKPSQIDIWMHQIVAQLSNDLPIQILLRMQAVETVREKRAPMHI